MGLARPRDLAPVSPDVHPLHRHVFGGDSRSPGQDRDWLSWGQGLAVLWLVLPPSQGLLTARKLGGGWHYPHLSVP